MAAKVETTTGSPEKYFKCVSFVTEGKRSSDNDRLINDTSFQNSALRRTDTSEEEREMDKHVFGIKKVEEKGQNQALPVQMPIIHCFDVARNIKRLAVPNEEIENRPLPYDVRRVKAQTIPEAIQSNSSRLSGQPSGARGKAYRDQDDKLLLTMRIITSLVFGATALLTLAHCAPAAEPLKTTTLVTGAAACLALCGDDDNHSNSNGNSPPASNPGAGPANSAQTTCSADTSNAAVADFANTSGWVGAMNGCLYTLNQDSWTGDHPHMCSPKDQSGNKLGNPDFGFYSKGEKWNDQENCFQKCQPCLSRGINKHLAVTTYCRYDAGGGSWCEMGFVYEGT
ncbi:MAG: hypothetical protein Q9220_004792 [cf. Caloplaca sp. 1 TL-2023]